MSTISRWLLLSPAVGLLLLFLVGPIVLMVRVSLYESGAGRSFYHSGTWTLANYAALWNDAQTHQVARFTLLAALGITTLTLSIAYPLALFIHALSPRAKRWAIVLVLLPKLCNVLVLVYGVQLILGSSGPISQGLLLLGIIEEPILLYRNLTGMVIGETYLLLPYAVLLILVGLMRVDSQLIEAARGLGAGEWTVFTRVIWPLSLPGLIAAGQLTMLWALGMVLGPMLLGGPTEVTMGVEIQRQALEYHRWPKAAALATGMLLLVLALSLGRWTHRE
jgi:ABC-type spermidine/putrescine transport system permease subunit I